MAARDNVQPTLMKFWDMTEILSIQKYGFLTILQKVQNG
jgi:hypothetical protein